VQIVKTDKGYVSGTLLGEPGKEMSIFKGIPFAAPPVGDLLNPNENEHAKEEGHQPPDPRM
jgi:carboxylesterase type B